MRCMDIQLFCQPQVRVNKTLIAVFINKPVTSTFIESQILPGPVLEAKPLKEFYFQIKITFSERQCYSLQLWQASAL